jgi:hypothetical protein
MNISTRLGIVTATAVMTGGSLFATPATAAAAPCVSGQEVSAQVHALVASLKDDVKSPSARAATTRALVQTVRTMRGAKATTAEQRQGMGEQISALAKRLHTASNRVERKALVAQILALTEQRSRGAVTDADRAAHKAAVAALKAAVTARTNTPAEDRGVAEAFKALHEQWNCPAS